MRPSRQSMPARTSYSVPPGSSFYGGTAYPLKKIYSDDSTRTPTTPALSRNHLVQMGVVPMPHSRTPSLDVSTPGRVPQSPVSTPTPSVVPAIVPGMLPQVVKPQKRPYSHSPSSSYVPQVVQKNLFPGQQLDPVKLWEGSKVASSTVVGTVVQPGRLMQPGVVQPGAVMQPGALVQPGRVVMPTPGTAPQVLKPGSLSQTVPSFPRCESNVSTASGLSSAIVVSQQSVSTSARTVHGLSPPQTSSSSTSPVVGGPTGSWTGSSASSPTVQQQAVVPAPTQTTTIAGATTSTASTILSRTWAQGTAMNLVPAVSSLLGSAITGPTPFPTPSRKQGAWMEALIQKFWPSVAEFIGYKLKAKFRGREIYIDHDIDKAVKHLAKKPLPLPMTVEWIDDFVAVLWPMFRSALNNLIKKSILPGIKKNLPSFLQSIDIDPCSLGDTPPRLKPIKILPQGTSTDGWMDLQLDLDYEGDSNIELVYRGRSVGLKGLTVKMSMIMSFQGFMNKPLFFHGFSICMCKPPEIDLKWGGMLEFIDMNFVESLVVKIIKDSLGSMMLLPNRMAVALAYPSDCNVFAMQRPKPRGLLKITVMEAEGLVGNEYDMSTLITGELSTDPFVTVAIGAENWRSSTVWNQCNPKWEEGESQHVFLVDMPQRQNIEIHVFDDGFVQKLRAKANMDTSEGDEIARNLDMSILELLGRPAWDPLEEEILVEKWINLDSWWAGRGMGPDVEDFVNEDPKAKRSSIFSSAMDWAKDKMAKRREKHQEEDKQKLLEAKARLRIRAHWRHIGTGMPVAPKAPAAPSMQVAAPAQMAPGVMMQQPRMQPQAGAIVPSGSAPGGVAPPRYVAQPVPGRPGVSVMVPVQQPAQQYQLQYRGLGMQPSYVPMPGVPRPMMALPPGSVYSHPPSTQVSYQPPVASVAPSAVAPSAAPSVKAASKAGSDVAVDEDDWDRWPTYILRVGIGNLEKLNSAPEDTAKYYVKCDTFPIVTPDCKEMANTTENMTTHFTKKRSPAKGSVAGLAMTMAESEVLARKMGIMMSNGVPLSTIADVLDIDEKTATKILGVAMAEKSNCRDIPFTQSFVYYVRHPELVELNFDVFSEVPKQEPSALGSITLNLKDAMENDNLCMNERRVELEGATSARLDIECQLWPVISSGVPISTLIERATAAERAALAAQGHGVKMAVWIIHARNLRNTDLFGGKSDPYCFGNLELDGKAPKEVFRTEVIDDNENPDWDFGPVTVEWNGERLLRFEVYDKDLVGSGDKLGEATLSREQCLQGLYTDLDLGEGNGTLRMKVAPMVGDHPLDVPYTKPQAKPKLQIWVNNAKGLKGVNMFGGKSDPYVICSLSAEKTFQTPVIDNELDPVWNHGPEELILGTELDLKFEVRDKDMIGSTSLGTATLTRDQCMAGFDGQLRLGKGKGTINVKVQPLRPGPELPPAKLDVSILSAKDLKRSDLFGFGKSDPYVMVKVKDQLAFKTKVIWGNLNPEWNHGPIEVDLQREANLHFEVYDKDMFKTGDIIGKVSIHRDKCLAGFEGDLDLGTGNGHLRVCIKKASGTATVVGGAQSSSDNSEGGGVIMWAGHMVSDLLDFVMRNLCGIEELSQTRPAPAPKDVEVSSAPEPRKPLALENKPVGL